MPRLLAMIPEDGWAFVRDVDTIYFVRPPFRKSERIPISEAAFERTVAVSGYEPTADVSEEPWSELVQRIQANMRRLDANASFPSNAEMLSRLLRSGPLSVLTGLLDKVEQQWLPKGDLRTAQRALSALIEAERVKEDKLLLQRTSSLLQRLMELHNEKEARAPRRIRPERIDLVAGRPSVVKCKAALQGSGAARMVGIGA